MIKGVIFDLDGTLADTIGDLGYAMNEMLRSFSFPERNREQIISAICYGQREFVIRSMPEDKRGDTALVDNCQECYASCYDKCANQRTVAYEGIVSALDILKSKGVRLAVVTNKAQGHATTVVKQLFGDGMFDTVIGGVKGQPPKPDPATALKAAEIMGVKPEECAFVGDSDVDILTGINAGMVPVGVTWGYRSREVLTEAGARLLADDAEQMLDIILSR